MIKDLNQHHKRAKLTSLVRKELEDGKVMMKFMRNIQTINSNFFFDK